MNSDSLIKQPTFSYKKIFPRFLHFVFLNIYCRFNITNTVPHSPDDGSLELKYYSVDFASQ